MRSAVFTLLLTIISMFSTTGQNNAPVAVPDSIEIMQQVPVMIDVKANDYDPDGDQILISFVDPTLGEAIIMDEKIRYKSFAYTGFDYIRYKVKDNQTPALNSNLTYVKIKVLPNPDVPVAVPDTFELVKLLPHSINLVDNDFDLNGDTFKIHEISSPQHCTVFINQDSVSVTITTDLDNLSTFRYLLKESDTETDYFSHKVTVRIIATENPDMPVISPDTAYTTGGITVVIPVLENDSDPQGEAIEIKGFTNPMNGTIEQNGGSLTYTPHFSFAGIDQFSYSIREENDNSIYTSSAWVKIFVNKNPHCPVGVADTAYGTTYIPMTIDVLPNDFDPDGDIFVIKDVSKGTITSDNKILYQSTPLAMDVDSLFYRIMESGNPLSYSEWIKVTVQLAVNPDLPVAVDDYVTTHAGVPIEIRPLLNDIQNAQDTLVFHGAYNNSIDGSKGVVINSNGFATYIPAHQAEGQDKLFYYISNRDNTIITASGNIFMNIEKQPFYDSIAINNINAGVNANGYLFSKTLEIPGNYGGFTTEIDPHFRYPANTMTSTIFTSSFWIGGIDPQGELHTAIRTYIEPFMSFQAGPIAFNYDSDHYLQFGRIWKLSKAEIEYHRQNYQSQGYQPIEVISSWPGNGNIALGQAPVLAPYMDINNDGFYNCLDGDYPLIRGDQTLFLMYNDDVNVPGSDVLPIKAEIHAMTYAFDAPDDTALHNTVFVHFDIINRSTETYHNCWLGVFTDPDIGYASDDYIRCDVTRGSYYCYNGKEIDGNGEFWAYGENPPAQSVTVLAGPYKDPDGLDNPGEGCNESVNGLNFGNGIADDERSGLTNFNNLQKYYYEIPIEPPPLTGSDYYNFMNNVMNDGTHFMYGGNGHPEMGAIGPECNFMFPGNSDPLNWGTGCVYPGGGYNQGEKFWTEEEAGNLPGDKRGIGAMGPFTFNPEQVQEVDIAYCVGQGTSGPGSSVNQLLRNIDSLINKTAFHKLIIPNNELGIKPVRLPENFGIFPNPSSGFITLQGLPTGQSTEYSIYSVVGPRVAEGRLVNGANASIDVSFLSPGMYIIRLSTGKSILTGKFIRK
ncbi:MAG: Ig-like domain-containing protein [Bacteroidota bacterium]